MITIPSTSHGLPTIVLFVQQFIHSFLLRPPTDLIILSNIQPPSVLLQSLLQDSSITVPRQLWNLAVIQHFNDLIDFRLQSPRTQVIFITIIDNLRAAQNRYTLNLTPLQSFYNTRIMDSFLHTHMLIFPDEPAAFEEHHRAVWYFNPPDAAILAAVYDIWGHISRVSRDLRHWQSTAEFLDANNLNRSTIDLAFDPLRSTLAERQQVMRNRIVPLDNMFYTYRWMASSPMRRDQRYIRLLEQYFRCTVTAHRGSSGSLQCYDEKTGNWSAYMQPYGWLGAGLLSDVMVPRIGRHQYAVLVPNWWHKRWIVGGGSGISADESSGRQNHRAVILCVMCTVIFAVFVGARFVFGGQPDWGLIVLDTWSRMLGNGAVCEEHSADNDDGHHPHLGYLTLLLSVWGLLNGLTMTTLWLDMSVNRVWMPVFQSIDDVERYPNITIVYDDLAALLRYIGLPQRQSGILDEGNIQQYIDQHRQCAMLMYLDATPNWKCRHVSNGSAVYRIIRDVQFFQEGSLLLHPKFMRPRLQQLIRRMEEMGLQQHIDAMVVNRYSLNRVWLEESDWAYRAMKVGAGMDDWIHLGAAFCVMIAFCVCVFLGECCCAFAAKLWRHLLCASEIVLA